MPRRPILLVANSSWNLSHLRGGLIRGLTTAGVGPLEAVVPEGEDPPAGLPTHHIPLSPDGMAPQREARSLLALIRLFRRVRPAAVLSFTPKANIYAGLAARASSTPFLPNVSGLGTGFLRGGLLQRIQAAMYREALRYPPRVFFQNRDDAALFRSMGLVREGQIAILPGSGVDTDAFASRPLPHRNPESARLLYVGRLLGDKGLRELAGAMRRLKPRFPGIELTLLGGPGEGNPSAISPNELGGWVADGLLFHADHAADVRPHLAAAHGVILPSYREGLPRSLIEAAATGRPLLAADVPGCREIVRPGVNGLLFAPRSEAAIAEAIERFLLAPPVQHRSWAEQSRRIAEQEYDERIVVRAYRDAVIALTEKGS